MTPIKLILILLVICSLFVVFGAEACEDDLEIDYTNCYPIQFG